MGRAVVVWLSSIATLAAIGWYLWVVDFHLTPPATQVAADWNSLFTIIFWIALVVAIFVWGLLGYALVRFRAKKGGPKEGPHIHGNVKLEVAWTIAPAIVMGWLLVISYQGLFAIDMPQEEEDFTVEVQAYRFGWIFTYPDGTQATNNTLRVEQNRMVMLNITSQDVIHAFGVPQLAVMKDAVPGRTNHAWFKANLAGEFLFNCRELCGVGHSRMGGKVIVFPEGSEGTRMYGFGGAATPTTPPSSNGTQPPADGVPIRLGPGLKLNPSDPAIEKDTEVTFSVRNDDTLPHNLYIGPKYSSGSPNSGALAYTATTLKGGESTTFTFSYDKDALLEIWCNVGGHYEGGMKGTLKVGKGGELAGGDTPLLPGFEPMLLVAALVGAAFVLRRRA